MENELPKGWVRTTLDEIRIDLSTEVEPSKFPEQSFELYSVPSFESGMPEIVHGSDIGSNKQVVETDTVLLCKINPRINRVWVVGHFSDYPKIASTEWIPFFQLQEVIPKYLCYYLSLDAVRDYLAANASGVGGSLMRVTTRTITGYPFPLAPLPEQRRIVLVIEQQFSRLDAAVTSLQHARAKLKRQRASILKAAVDGTLTEQWRAEHPASETAEQLMQRILIERCTKWEAEQSGKKKVYKEPEPPDTTNLPKLPEDWVWTNVGQVSYFVRYGTSAKTSEDNTGIPVLRMGNIQDGALELSNLKYLPADHSEFPSLLLEDGDMLFNRTNSAELVGKSAVYHGNPLICSYASYLIVARLIAECLSDYLCYFLNSSYGRAWVKSVVSQQVGQANVNGTKLQALAFPLPPFAEQQQIVSEVEARLSIIAQTELEVEANLKRAERLRQTILAEAFAGRLVPQDPDDEPASVLLERIREERKGREVEKKAKNGNGRAIRMPDKPVKLDVEGVEQVELWESVGG